MPFWILWKRVFTDQRWHRIAISQLELGERTCFNQRTLEEMARWSFCVGAFKDGLRRRRECKSWQGRSCRGWPTRERNRRSAIIADCSGVGATHCESSKVWWFWGWGISHIIPDSTLCHLLFCCNAALICTQSSLLQDCDLKIGRQICLSREP